MVDRHFDRPRRAALEVGATAPSRTLLHLKEEGILARWPYGSDRIWLIVNFDHWRFGGTDGLGALKDWRPPHTADRSEDPVERVVLPAVDVDKITL